MRKLLGKLLMCGVLELAVLHGVKVTPEEIENLMEVMTRVKVAHVIKKERDRDPRKRLKSRK